MNGDLREVLRAKARDEIQPAVERIRAGVHAHVEGGGASTPTRAAPTKSRYAIISIAMAAIIAIVAINYASTPLATLDTRIYSTASAQRANITLPDGSQVMLAPATTIRVTNREVELNGEAVFTVIKQTGEPFMVHTNNSTTRVLGTTFSIRRYSNDSVTRVAVRDGKVEVNSFTLSANNIGQVDNTGAVLVRANANVADILSWTSGSLMVRNRPLGEVISDLERWYGVEIRLADSSLFEQRVSGSFTESSARELRGALEFILGARAELNGKVLTIHAK